MAEENVVRKRTREENEEDVKNELPEAKRAQAGHPHEGLMAFLDRIDNMDKNEEEEEEEKNNVLKPTETVEEKIKELATPSVENNNNNNNYDFNFNDGFIDIAEELETSYFHFCDEDGGLMAVYSTHHGFVPDYSEVNDFCHGGTLWEDDIWQLESNEKVFRYV